jgi:hypothetical protein
MRVLGVDAYRKGRKGKGWIGVELDRGAFVAAYIAACLTALLSAPVARATTEAAVRDLGVVTHVIVWSGGGRDLCGDVRADRELVRAGGVSIASSSPDRPRSNTY